MVAFLDTLTDAPYVAAAAASGATVAQSPSH